MTGSERSGRGDGDAVVVPAPEASPGAAADAEADPVTQPSGESPAPASAEERGAAPAEEAPAPPVESAEEAENSEGEDSEGEEPPAESGPPDEEPETPPAPDSLLAAVEALLFSHGEPAAPQKLAAALDEPPERIEAALAALEIRWNAPASGLRLARVAGGFQLTTRAELREVIERLLAPKRDDALSESALDALSVIAYRQPITLPELNEMRGVNSQSVVSTLLRRRLVRARGRKPVVGRPLLYGTTPEFLERFGLDGLDDLPELRELADPAAAPAEGASPASAEGADAAGPESGADADPAPPAEPASPEPA